MKRNRVFRLLASLTVVVLCMTAFSVTALAGGGDGDYYTGEPATESMEPEGQPLTPEGNAMLVDDYYGDKQLITVTTKAGNYFYILIDRANEDKETAVHFLNQVDEADLMALMEDGQTEEKPAACTCAEKCQAGAVNTDCPVCAVNMSGLPSYCMGNRLPNGDLPICDCLYPDRKSTRLNSSHSSVSRMPSSA